MPHQIGSTHETFQAQDELAVFIAEIEAALQQEHYQRAADLLEGNAAAAWFGMPPPRTMEILRLLVSKLPSHGSMLHAGYALLTATEAGQFDHEAYLSTVDTENPEQMFLLALFRVGDFRSHGRTSEALDQCDNLQEYLGKMHPITDPHDGWSLQASVQTGITAMLAGDFKRALTAFTQAQLHVTNPKYGFLSRDALVKSALIQACFGNPPAAQALLARAEHIPRTSSWAEQHIDAHVDITRALTQFDNSDEALDLLVSISLNDVGEMWPFYIVAIHRLFEATGYLAELDHQLEMYDAMPFPRVDGDGFSGSIIPLKRALLAMKTGRQTEAQEFLDRADQRLTYTRLHRAAGHIYAARTQQAIQEAAGLRHETRGYRHLEIRRLSILAAAQFQAENSDECIAALQTAASLPRGLFPSEVALFSPETRGLATQHVASWPKNIDNESTFLIKLPNPAVDLSEREIHIVEQLAKGHTRAQAADNLFISVNTLKTQLQSVYRKLDVSSASDAVLGAQRLGLL